MREDLIEKLLMGKSGKFMKSITPYFLQRQER